MCLASYAIHSRTQYDGLDAALQTGADHIAAELDADHTPQAREKTLLASTSLGLGVRLYDVKGGLLQESAGGARVPVLDSANVLNRRRETSFPAIAALAPSVHRTASDSGSYRILHSPSGDRWRVYVLPIARGTQYLATTLPIGPVDEAVAVFARAMILIAVFASLLALPASWLLARRTLRPVAALTTSAIAQSRAFSRRVIDSGDPDELARLAATFNGVLATLEGAYEAQQRFLAAASHELRAPLTLVQANLELLLRAERGLTEKDRAQMLGEAYGEARRMGRLVADLLVLARVDTRAPLRREPVELDRVVLQVVGEMRRLSGGVSLEIASFEPAVVEGDPDGLKQVVLILLDNAIKYTGAGGRVTVNLQRAERGARVVVRDTGVGIAPADLPHVFERFYRADAARAHDTAGTGLGLSIARAIAEAHGGTVDLTSAPGGGTTATLWLPASDAPPHVASPRQPRSHPDV